MIIIKIRADKESKAEYIAKLLINEATKEQLPVSCTSTKKTLLGYEKRVKIGNDS